MDQRDELIELIECLKAEAVYNPLARKELKDAQKALEKLNKQLRKGNHRRGDYVFEYDY